MSPNSFYQLAGFTRFFALQNALPYDKKWDKYVRANIDGIRPVYYDLDHIDREPGLVWINDHLLYVGIDDPMIGYRLAIVEGSLMVSSGSPSRRTKELIRAKLKEIQENFKLYDSWAILGGPKKHVITLSE